jgi:hypothetical protein
MAIEEFVYSIELEFVMCFGYDISILFNLMRAFGSVRY